MIKKIFVLLALSLLITNAIASITVIVPFSAGGAYDKIAREFSNFVKIKTGEDVFVENKIGAGSIIGTNALVNTKQPNNTLLVTSSSFFDNIIEAKFKKEEFRLVSVLGNNPCVLITSIPKNLSCEDIKSKNNKFFIGTAGTGSVSNTAAELLIRKYPNITIVPYKGVSMVLTDLIPGRLDFAFTSGLKNRDDIKIIATTTTDDLYKGITNWKSCLDIDINYNVEYLIVANANASDEFIKKINALSIEFIRQPGTIEQFNQDGIMPQQFNLKDTTEYYSTSLNNWKKFLKKTQDVN